MKKQAWRKAGQFWQPRPIETMAWCDHARELPEKFSQDSTIALDVIVTENCDKLVSPGWPLRFPYKCQASTARHSIER